MSSPESDCRLTALAERLNGSVRTAATSVRSIAGVTADESGLLGGEAAGPSGAQPAMLIATRASSVAAYLGRLTSPSLELV
ncbi:MAG: hypothetical protein HW416_963 [Chloroflexi bacterium]|nr:hypothetical protein [Chloroflexota bacterium]